MNFVPFTLLAILNGAIYKQVTNPCQIATKSLPLSNLAPHLMSNLDAALSIDLSLTLSSSIF